MKTTDPYKVWFCQNFERLFAEYFSRKRRIVFDAFCNGEYMSRREPLPFQIGSNWELQP